MQRADVGIVASGTATLEAAFFRMPFVLVYRVAWLTYFAARLVVKVKHLGMPNVLAEREIVPEFIQAKAKPSTIAHAILDLLGNESHCTQMIADFDSVIAKLGTSGASENAARAILAGTEMSKDIEKRIARLHADRLIDMHFDLPLSLFWNRARQNVVTSDFLDQFEAGDIALLGVATYVEDKHLPAHGLQVALDQIARVYVEVENTPRLMLCKTFADIQRARNEDRIGLMLTMEGAEPLRDDPDLLRVFYELGLRAVSLTHARPNAAAAGGIFAASGSPPTGLTKFGRDVVRGCQELGILIDLAHINAAGFEEICSLTSGPLIVSHTNSRRYYDIERNISDEQVKDDWRAWRRHRRQRHPR